jgi:hypothetical protein
MASLVHAIRSENHHDSPQPQLPACLPSSTHVCIHFPAWPQVLALVLGHASAGITRDVAKEVVASLALVAAEAAGTLPASPGRLLAGLSLAQAPPCRDVLASDPQAACGLGTACARLAAAAAPASGGEAPALAAAAMATAGACVGHALAAARQGRLGWQQLAELAGAALEPARSLPSSPDTMAPVLEAAAEVGGASDRFGCRGWLHRA